MRAVFGICGARALAERFVRRALTIALLGCGLASCGAESVDGEPFQDESATPSTTFAPGTGGGSSSAPGSYGAGNSSTSQTAAPSGCCRICVQGKACGDSCISAELTCQVGAGCACDG